MQKISLKFVGVAGIKIDEHRTEKNWQDSRIEQSVGNLRSRQRSMFPIAALLFLIQAQSK